MKIAIVGASGFIGGCLTQTLIKQGIDFYAMDRKSLIEEINPDIVFYLAGRSTPSNDQFIDQDLDYLEFTLTALKHANKTPVFVLASSAGAVYDVSTLQPFAESSSTVPSNIYGRGKLQQEEIILNANWVHPIILRLSNIYGPQQKLKPGFGVINHWIDKIERNEPIEIMGNAIRDYLFIDDLIRLFLIIVKDPSLYVGGITANVASGQAVSLQDLYRIFSRVLGRDIAVIQRPSRLCDIEKVEIDISLARELFNWSPLVSLDQGIELVLRSKGLA